MVRFKYLLLRNGRILSFFFCLLIISTIIHYFYTKEDGVVNNNSELTNFENGSIFYIPHQEHSEGLNILKEENNLRHKYKNDSLLTADSSSFVHAFYYAWYGNPTYDDAYIHWNHRFLGHWKPEKSHLYAAGKRHKPPDDIGSNFYPLLGPYSSLDPNVIQRHMEYLRMAGIGVIALSWYPPGVADDEGKPSDKIIPAILSAAADNGIKVCFHIEPYAGRNAFTVAKNIKSLNTLYANHPAFYQTNHPKKNIVMPLYYVYDSYLIDAQQWSSVLDEDGKASIRDGDGDAMVIGLLVEKKHKRTILNSGFDGFYTYFASDGFSYGSLQYGWKELSAFAKENNLLFIPSVGPGYDDTNIRPWNDLNMKPREKGGYYEKAWMYALDSQPDFVSITSFNEWHEGSQIEPAVYLKNVYADYYKGILKSGWFHYESYGQDPNFYLDLTRKWVRKFYRPTV